MLESDKEDKKGEFMKNGKKFADAAVCEKKADLADRAACAVMRLLTAYCSWMECNINSRSRTGSEVMFEAANALSAMSKLLSVLIRIAAKTEGADTEDQCQPL